MYFDTFIVFLSQLEFTISIRILEEFDTFFKFFSLFLELLWVFICEIWDSLLLT